MKSFWQSLPKPFFALAPMADVTDPAYRKLISETAPPDVMWTEFVSADGIFHTREKKGMRDAENPLMRDLQFSKGEHPIVAQFFTSNPDNMEYVARLALTFGFDGVDINMGCPDKSIEKQGAGAAHMKDPARAREVIRGALRGTQGKIPVSVKTRLGFNAMEYASWLPEILAEDISALAVHMRTRKEMSKVPAHWELAHEVVRMCKKIRPDIVLMGNGDLIDIQDAQIKAQEYGFDGMMLGRAIFGNPWLFAKEQKQRTPTERIMALRALANYFSKLQPTKHHAILKKHFKAFITGFDGASELRTRLMNTSTFEEMEKLLSI